MVVLMLLNKAYILIVKRPKGGKNGAQTLAGKSGRVGKCIGFPSTRREFNSSRKPIERGILT